MMLSPPAKKLLQIIMVCAAAFVAGGILSCFILPSLSAADILPVSLGILLSSVICAAKVFLLEYQVIRLSEMDNPNKARGLTFAHSLFRYVLTGGGLVAAHYLIPFDTEMHIFNPGLIAALFGAFIWNVSVYALKFAKIEE